MIQKLRYAFSRQFRFLACLLSLFFVVLAVFDGFEVEDKIEYQGHFFDEADFDYVDFPTSISRPSTTAASKFQRIELFRIYDFFLSITRLEIKPSQILSYIPVELFSSLEILVGKSISMNAP
ncbi:hypothetical protein [Arthrospiribacter ruber]|uniref:hypothetical protein n=1 Tax=Arthrospiribacter ruber TaxID=2487934 RepID=UPI001FE4BF2F|nr:hypothetical protein [Arthrospiribacter ruber]